MSCSAREETTLPHKSSLRAEGTVRELRGGVGWRLAGESTWPMAVKATTAEVDDAEVFVNAITMLATPRQAVQCTSW